MNKPSTDKKMYQERGFSQRVGFGHKPALLIIDVINAFTDQDCPLGSNLDKEVVAIQELLIEFRAKGFPVHFTTTAYEDGFASAGVFIKKVPSLAHLKLGSDLIEIDKRIKPESGEVVWTKQYASAFFGTALASTLTAQNVDTLIVTGCTTSGCVRASAVDSCQNGFHTIVVEEAVGDRSEAAHEANLFDLDAKYADVVSLEKTIKYFSNI